MIHLFPRPTTSRHGVTRRQWLTMSAFSAVSGLTLPQRLLAREEGLGSSRPATAKNCIYIFLCGGPSQPDLWDMKPDAPVGVRSVFEPIQTTAPGIHFGSLLPSVARHAHQLALIRSMTHADNNHTSAIVHSLLGQLPQRPNDFHVARGDHPGLGAILHKLLGGCGNLPAWTILPRYFGTYSPPYKGQSAGFLGSAFDPLMFDKERKGSLSDAPLTLDALRLPESVDGARMEARRVLLSHMTNHAEGDAGGEATASPHGNAATAEVSQNYERAFDLLTTNGTSRAFDLTREPDAVRERYGRNEYGQSFLMARRLVEAGVRMVNVFWTFFDAKGCQFNLWDNHGVANDTCGIDGQLTGLQQLTHDYCTPSFDKAFSALLEDLEQRGLLGETLVAVAGEFGRTPKINVTSGRDHWAHCYTQLLAGGGVRGGQAYGASDAQGAFVKDLPVTPDDFAATILYAFGLDPETPIYSDAKRPVRISSGSPVAALF